MPHSEIPGSKPVRGSPRLIAAYHVLHRLSAPRHPPDTLLALDCARNQKTDGSRRAIAGEPKPMRPPRQTSLNHAFRSEKTSFASNTSGIPRSGGDHDWYAIERQAYELRCRRPDLADRPSNRALLRRRNRMRFLFTMSWNERPDPQTKPDIASAWPLIAASPSKIAHRRRALQPSRRVRDLQTLVFHRNVGRPNDASRQTLVEPDGIEPTTSCLQSTRSPN